jgi:hypothetical protein
MQQNPVIISVARSLFCFKKLTPAGFVEAFFGRQAVIA